MALFFNGRLWASPAVMSVVDDSAMANPNPNVGNVLALLGTSTGGEPGVALRFGSAAEAANTLISGDLLDACNFAFDPSNELASGPATVICYRVNPATQASLTLNDSAFNPVVNLTSKDWGLWTNQIKVKVEAGSVNGFRLTAAYVNSIYTQDNVYRRAFSIQYSGTAGTAVMNVTNNQVVLQAPSGTAVATIDLTVYSQMQQLVDYINTVSGFSAMVLDGNSDLSALNGLDNVAGQDVMTAPYIATGTLQAVVDWFNGLSNPLVAATRQTNAGTAPALLPFTYLTGGSDGVTTNQSWSNAFTALQREDVQWVVPVSSSTSIWAMADAHVQFMSNVGRMERRAIVGEPLGTSDAQALADALTLNSDRTTLIHIGFNQYDAKGNLLLYPPYKLAALIGGALAGVNPGVALTGRSINIKGLERQLRNPTDTDPLITGGVFCIEKTKTGYRVVKSISTWLNNDNYDKVEVSTGAALDHVARSVREALEPLKGAFGSPATLALAVAKTETVLRLLSQAAPAGIGVLVGDTNNPAYKNITASIQGDVLAVSFMCSPVIPINYIPVTIFAVPYSGSLSVAS
jgi:hypothetical protein